MCSNSNLKNYICGATDPSRTHGCRLDWRLRSLVRHGRVVQEDAHLTIVAALVPKGVLDLRLFAGGGASEAVVAHGNGNPVLGFDLMVVVHAVRPALAPIGAAHKVRHRV